MKQKRRPADIVGKRFIRRTALNIRQWASNHLLQRRAPITMLRRWVILLAILFAVFVALRHASASGTKTRQKKQKQKQKNKPKKQTLPRTKFRSGPPFFLQPVADKWSCFAGDRFARCGMDTLWYQIGNSLSGINFQLRSAEEGVSMSSSSSSADSCLVRKSCDMTLDESMHVTIGSCEQPCSSLKWALENEGKSEIAVITFNNTQQCVSYNAKDKAMVLDLCLENTYAKMMQTKMSKSDLVALNATGHRLINAALQKDAETVTKYFENKADVNLRDWDDSTLLHAASASGDADMVRFLVSKHQADVNAHDRHLKTALMEAAKIGNLEIVSFLVEAGADADPVDLMGASPLMLAVENGHAAVAEFLLEQHSVDVNRQDSNGIHALGKACKEGSLEIVKMLLSAGARIDLPTNEGSSALNLALESEADTTTIVEYLLQNDAEVNTKSGAKDGLAPLSLASFLGKDKAVEMLIQKGAQVNYENFENITSLMYAASSGSQKVVRLLLDHGADVHIRHKDGATALFEAVVNGSLPIVEMLLEAGADFMVADKDNVTMLHTAAESGHTRICEILLDKGIPVDAMANAGTTPLMHATFLQREDTVRLLLARNADVNVLVNATSQYIEDNELQMLKDPTTEPYEHLLSSLMIACKMGYLATAKMLIDSGAAVNAYDASDMSPLMHAMTAPSNSTELMKLLIEHGANPNDENFDKKLGERRSILLHAIVNNNTDLAVSLIEKGANVSFVDEDGLTVATHAAFLGNQKVIEEIISREGDLGAGSNAEGTDPLIAASAEGHAEVVQALLKTGRVNLNGRDIDGTNALMAASVRGHRHVANLLIKAGVDVNTQNVEGHTALMFAYNGKNQVEILLEKYKEYMKAAGPDNSTRLLQEALTTHSELIKLLLRGGADASKQDNLGHRGSDFDRSVEDFDL